MSFSSLSDFISESQIECLNEDSDYSVNDMFLGRSVLKSDIDAQLLISIPFSSPVKLNGIKIACTDNKDAAPSRVKLFINRISLGFGDAENLPAIQTLSFDQIESGETIPLKYVLFQNVMSLQIFVESNHGDVDKTEIAGIELFGSAGEKMDMKEFKKITHEH